MSRVTAPDGRDACPESFSDSHIEKPDGMVTCSLGSQSEKESASDR
jgi:hypothetical protein